jgi:hypothetical protein
MKFLMLVCVEAPSADDEEEPARAEEEAARAEEDNSSFPWLDEMIARGIRLDGDRLRPPNEATTVRVRDAEVLLVDGPFAETKEAIVGYDVIECADLDEAITVAAKHPVAEFGMIEVRPFWR